MRGIAEAPTVEPPLSVDPVDPVDLTHAAVLVVDDHETSADAVALALRVYLDGVSVTSAVRFDDALRAASTRRIDVALLDWHLGDRDGIDLAQQLRRADRRTRVVIVSAYDSTMLQHLGREAGACAVLSKHAPIVDVVDAVRRCLHGDELAWPADQTPATTVQLSDRQVQVLWLLSSGSTVKSVATQLHLSVETVRTYLKQAMRRLDAHRGPCR
jgi:two-component system response regulator DesR